MNPIKLLVVFSLYFSGLNFVLPLAAWSTSSAYGIARGEVSVRLDPGRLYQIFDFSQITPKKAAETLVQELSEAGVSKIFVFSYSPIYGAFYKTTYLHTHSELYLGIHNFLSHLLTSAHQHKIKVIASFQINNYKRVWEEQPQWRSRTRDQQDYKPQKDSYFLSTFSSAYKEWLRGFLRDFLIQFPHIDGIEVLEPSIDLLWDDTPDFHPEGQIIFLKQHPRVSFKSETWKRFRAQSLTELIGHFLSARPDPKIRTYLVQTWPAKPDGNLWNLQDLALKSGFDLLAITQLPTKERPDMLQIQLIWQQWKALYNTSSFVPQWPAQVFSTVKTQLNSLPPPILHIELSGFSGPQIFVKPNSSEFLKNLDSALGTGAPVDIYDYTYLKQKGLLSALAARLK